jgi:hypothetical protein
LRYLLKPLAHDVTLLREVLPEDVSDEAVLEAANERACILLTCNRDDFLKLATKKPHQGIIIVIRRRTRAAERAALFGSWSAPGRLASRTISTSPDRTDFAGPSPVRIPRPRILFQSALALVRGPTIRCSRAGCDGLPKDIAGKETPLDKLGEELRTLARFSQDGRGFLMPTKFQKQDVRSGDAFIL